MSTKKSFVYVIYNGTHYKIGKANNPNLRLVSLQTANVRKLRIVYTIECASETEALSTEAELHQIFAKYHTTLEWFSMPYFIIMQIMSKYRAIFYGFESNVYMIDIERLILMSKREQLIIRLMINNIKWVKDINSLQHVVELKPDSVDFNPQAIDYMPYSSFLKGFALLHAGDIMRRVAKHKYMLNPNFFIPTGPLAPHFRLIWQEAKQHPSITTPIVEPESFAFDDYESSNTDIF